MREFPSEDPRDDKRIQLYEVGPPELSHMIEDVPYSGISGGSESTLMPPDLQFFPDPAEAAAIRKMRRIHAQLDNTNYHARYNARFSASYRPGYTSPDAWDRMSDEQRKSLNRAEEIAAKQDGLVLAEISKLERAFPHLDFTMILGSLYGNFP